jgi:hypothetical protein
VEQVELVNAAMSRSRVQRQWVTWLPSMISIALVGLLYIVLLATYLQPLNGFWSSDQGTKLIQTQSLLLNRFSTNALIYPGEIYDPEHRFTPLRGTYYQHEGQTFSIWSPAFAALSSMPFFLFGYGGLYVVPVAATLVLLALCAVLARSMIGPPWDVVSVLVLGLASPLAFYSLVFWEHTLSALFITAALWLATIAITQSRDWYLIGTGVLIGFTVWFRIETILLSIAVMFSLLLVQPHKVLRYGIWLGIGFTVAFVPWLFCNLWIYGNLLGPHVAVTGSVNYQEGTTVNAIINTRLEWLGQLLIPGDNVLLLIITALVAIYVAVMLVRKKTFTLQMLPCSIILLIAIGVLGYQRIPLGLQTSLLITFPIVALCLLPTFTAIVREDGIISQQLMNIFINQSALTRLFLGCAVSFIVLACVIKVPYGGAQWGPRMLLPILPILTIVAIMQTVKWLRSDSPIWARGIVIFTATLLLSVSLYSEGWGIRRIAAFNADNHHVVTTVAQSNERVIITDIWYAPCVIAPLFYDGHLIYLLSNGTELDALVEQLQANGVERFYYLGTQGHAIRAEARVGPQLRQIGNETLLAHNLIGASYQINSR